MKREIGFFFLGVLTVAGCATSWPYRSYNAVIPDRVIVADDVGRKLSDLVYSEGLLWGKLGPEGWPDLGLDKCRPTPGNQMPCTTTLTPEFYNIKSDLQKCHVDLQECQKTSSTGGL